MVISSHLVIAFLQPLKRKKKIERSYRARISNYMSFFVSAPGKVILFGEHSAVYGKPAIAAALSLRCYLLVTPNPNSDDIILEFPDIGLVHKWSAASLPWDEIEAVTKNEGRPKATDELIPELLDALADALDIADPLHYTACRCFLYLYASLCSRQTAGCHFCIRSTLPIGAGLGSLAATAVCLLAALSILGGHVSAPLLAANDRHAHKDSSDATFIDAWSLMGEKCFHGNPSGIDNAVATHGGAVMYQRMTGPGNPSVRTSVRNFAALPLLLTNTRVPRRTAELVGGVAQLGAKYAPVTEAVLQAMDHVARHAYDLMVRPECDRAALSDLVKINHGLLVSLGVSHPSLEQVRIIADRHSLGATKLTGAGGGGCAITLLTDGLDPSNLVLAQRDFADAGFETFDATLGGKGVGMLKLGDVDTLAQEVVFSSEKLASYASREEIEQNIGASELPGWRFW